MRKLLFLLFLIIAIITFTTAFANEQDENILYISVNSEHLKSRCQPSNLPDSLKTIESSAFEGTALTIINLPEAVETIGDFAFANIPTLKNIIIPNNTTHIEKNAFKGSNHVTITTAPKTYARTWAKENGIPFIPITSFYAFNTPVQIIGLSQTRIEQQKLLLDGETTENKTPNLTGRMTGEIKADKYEEITAFHIQGRSPPIC